MTGNAAITQTQFTYGRMFDLPAFYAPDEALISLGMRMHKGITKPSDVPAGYTFLGQFIDHDLSLDPDGREFPCGIKDPSSLTNLRSPFFNLDILYGKGPSIDKHLYKSETSILLRLGDTTPLDIKKPPFPNDIPRKLNDFAAFVGDHRQDENMAIAQVHVAFIKFHNAVVKTEFNGDDSLKNFDAAKKIVVQHYQWIVLRDFLPRIIQPDVLAKVEKLVQKNKKRLYQPLQKTGPFMPVECSVAAFRMGHSMVTSAFNWNFLFPETTIHELSAFTGRGRMNRLTLFNPATGGWDPITTLPSRWIVDWRRFFDFTGIDKSFNAESLKSLNRSARIDTSIVPQFKDLMPVMGGPDKKYQASLAIRNLFRGRMLMLPSGQAVAAKLRLPAIPAEKLTESMDDPVKEMFGKNAPLWYYVLKEAEIGGGNRLGPMGSRILAETFLSLMKLSDWTILNESDWRPKLCPKERQNEFGMADMLKYVADQNQTFDELNPLGGV